MIRWLTTITSLYGKRRRNDRPTLLWLHPYQVQLVEQHLFGVRSATSSSQQPRSNCEALQWLRTSPSLQLGLTPSEMQKMINRFPILRYTRSDTIERTLRPTAEWLAHDFGLGLKGLKKCLISHPRVLYTSTTMLELRTNWLYERLSPELTHDGLLKMVLRRPQVLSYRPNNISPKIDWLEQRVGWTQRQLVTTLQRAPQMLEFSIEVSATATFPIRNRHATVPCCDTDYGCCCCCCIISVFLFFTITSQPPHTRVVWNQS